MYEVFGKRIVHIVKLCTVLAITLSVTFKPIVTVKCLFSVCDGYIGVREVVYNKCVCVALRI